MTDVHPTRSLTLTVASKPFLHDATNVSRFQFQLQDPLYLQSSVEYSASLRHINLYCSFLNVRKQLHSFIIFDEQCNVTYQITLPKDYFVGSFSHLFELFESATPAPARALCKFVYNEKTNRVTVNLNRKSIFINMSHEQALMLGFGALFVVTDYNNVGEFPSDLFYKLRTLYLCVPGIVVSTANSPPILRPISIDTVNFEKSLCLSLSFNDDYFAKIFCNMLSNFEIYFNATSSYDYQEITFDASASCSLVIDIRQRFALL